MEMASGCPRQATSQQSGMQEMPRRPVRGPHGGWQQREIDTLRTRIAMAEESGESLRSVFDEMSRELGRKPNSIRNFYYAQLREAQEGEHGRTLPFETFTMEEIEQLIRNVLTARAQGMSVRACVRKLADGDKSRMLRYQNKYRAVVRARPELVGRIMEELRSEGIAYVSPYPGEGAKVANTQLAQLKTRAQETGDAQIMQLFSALDHLLTLACEKPKEDDAPMMQAEDSSILRRADRLKAQLDITRLALDDEKQRMLTLRSETESMVTIIKEFIALPEQERTDRCAAFCHQAANRLSAVECALMDSSI